MIVLENEDFRVEINPFGAELTSFRSKTTGTEYVWGSDPAAWKRHAPVLFPRLSAASRTRPTRWTARPLRSRSMASAVI